MSESDWLSCSSPLAMRNFLQSRGPVCPRKLTLFAATCARLVWDRITDEQSRTAVEVAERVADGTAGVYEFGVAHRAAILAEGDWVRNNSQNSTPDDTGAWMATHAAVVVCRMAADCLGVEHEPWDGLSSVVTTALCSSCSADVDGASEARFAVANTAFRDIFGNPFRPVSFSPSWRTEAVVSLARGIYQERAYDRMPVLADALEEAGCADPWVLGHCRRANGHVRGCWVVDSVLGKT